MINIATRHKPLFAIGLSCLCFWVLSQQIAAVTWDALWLALQGIAGWQWAMALAATAISFLAMGAYDVVWHRALNTGVPASAARTSGMASLAIAQTVGLGSVTGAFLRWHLLDPLAFRKAAGITVAVCCSFLGCWAVIVVFGAVLSGAASFAAFVFGAIGLGLGAYWLSQHGELSKHRRLFPRLFGLTLVDLVFAALALWVLLPDPGLTPFITLFMAFTLALGAGLISNAPGGVGAFELVLLSVVATVPDADLLAAVIAFRVIYYLIPALCGGVVLLASHLRVKSRPVQTTCAPNSDLFWQGATSQIAGQHRTVARRHLLGTVALEPTQWDFHNTSQHIVFTALYKCGPKDAATARQRGWTIRRIASDALIDLQAWTTSGPKFSQLRRKLRQAEKAGVSIVNAGSIAPCSDMDAVAAAWKTAHGGELGYAMGRYTPEYVARQQTYLIYNAGALCGFVTVQARPTAWAIDLIRHLPHLPQGAMHAAITQIIADAADAGVTTLSLGAVPDGPDDNAVQRLCRKKKAGLRQFKAAFNPQWAPRYHAAPSAMQFGLSLSLIVLHIQRPWARLWPRLWGMQRNLMNIPRIIHLLHIKRYETPLPE